MFRVLTAVSGICGLLALGVMLAASQAAPVGTSSIEDEYRQLIDARGQRSETVRLDRLVSLYLQEKRGRLKESVVNGQKALWISLSDTEVAAVKKRTTLALAAVQSINEAELPPPAKLDRRMLLHLTKSDIDLSRFPTEYFAPFRREYWYPADDHAATWRFGDLPHGSSDDYEHILARLRGIPLRLVELRQTLQQGLARGVVSPRRDVEAFLRLLRADMTTDPLASCFLTAFRQFPSWMPAQQQAALTADAATIYRTAIQPAYAELTQYLETTYLPASPAFASMSTLPNGTAWYAAHLRARTGLELGPEDIHREALAEVRRTQGELDAIARSVGFTGTYDQFILSTKENPRCATLDANGVRTQFQSLMRQVEDALPKLFGLIPKTPYEVVPGANGSPELSRGSIQEGSLKLGRPSRILVQAPYDASCDFVTVMLHEAVPGHVFQIHIAAEYANISELRRQLFLWNRTPFSEGWATYAQGLTTELGLKPDAYQHAQAVAGSLWMAARTVVDTGIHAKGWSRDKAMEYYRATVGWGQLELVEGVVDRVALDPAGYLVYVVGRQKIAALRTRAEKELGSRFDIRKFHDEILRNGPLPFDVLDAQIQDWIAAQRNH